MYVFGFICLIVCCTFPPLLLGAAIIGIVLLVARPRKPKPPADPVAQAYAQWYAEYHNYYR